jgi:hypothetical protein
VSPARRAKPSAAGEPRHERRRAWRITGGLFVVALLLNLLLLADYRDDPFFDAYVSDALSYDAWADRLAANGLGAEPVFHQSPLFPLLLARVYAAVEPGARRLAALALQAFLTAGAIALLVPLGRVWFRSTSAGVAAAVLALLHGPVLFWSLKLLPLPLALLTQAAALLALGVARERRGPAIAFGCGLLWGVACLARSEMLLFLPLALAALAFVPPSGRARSVRLLALLAGVGFVVAPATAHNLARGDRVLIGAAGGENLFIGNQRGATGGHKALDPRAGDLFSQRELGRQLAAEALGPDPRPSEVSRYWARRALDEVRSDVPAWLVLESRKAARVLHPGDPTDMYSLPLERQRFLATLQLLRFPYWGLLFLAVIGAALAPRSAWPLLAFLGVHVMVLLLFFVSTRLRLPLVFFLTPFAGLALSRGIALWRDGRRGPVLATAGVVALFALADPWFSRVPDREVLRLASVLSSADRLDESLAVLRPRLDDPSVDPLLLDQAGWVEQKGGRLAAAVPLYERALAAGLPAVREPGTRTRLANTYEALGRITEAAEQHDLAVGSRWASAETVFWRGVFRLNQRDRDGAIEDMLRAAREAPQWPDPRRALRSLGVTPPPE